MNERGQATVELALCLPLVALLLAAVVQVGLLVADQARLWHAAREAARTAVVEPDPNAARQAVRRVGLDHVDVGIVPEPAHRVQGKPLRVSLSYRPPDRVPLLGKLVRRVELRAAATMRIEQP